MDNDTTNSNLSEIKHLIEDRKFEEASAVLIQELDTEPDDLKKRLLADCYYGLEKYDEAIQISLAVDEVDLPDYALRVFSHWRLDNWNEMSTNLKQMIEIQADSRLYHLLAVAEAKGKYGYEVDDASKQIMRGYLSKAIGFEDCKADIFLWLFSLYSWEDIEQKKQVLEQAFIKYPGNHEICIKLASFYLYHTHDYSRILEIVSPLLNKEEAQQAARWCSFEAHTNLEQFSEAEQLLDKIEFDNPTEKARIKADLLFRQGKINEWLIHSELYADDGSRDAIIRRYFRKAYINLRNNELSSAIQNLIDGTDILMKHDDHTDFVIFLYFADQSFNYKEFDVILDVSESLLLLKDENPLITNAVVGRLAYIFYSQYSQGKQDEIIPLLTGNTSSLLDMAGQLLEYPPCLGYQLAYHYIDTDIAATVQHHLAYCMWAINVNEIEYLPDFEEYTTVYTHLKTEDELEEQIEQNRQAIHDAALTQLMLCDDNNTVEAVFITFYNEFWRDVLLKGKLYSEIVTVAERFIDATNGQKGLFDFAYASSQLDRIDEAEKTYKRLLELEPQNSAAANNLGVIFQKKGLLKDAQDLFKKAKELQPSDKLYASNLENVNARLDTIEKAQDRAKEAFDEIREKARDWGLSPEQHAELNEAYWAGELSIQAIEQRFRVNSVYNYVLPQSSGKNCPNCTIEMVYKSRSARSSKQPICLGCGHNSKRYCNCNHCVRQRAERKRQAEAAARKAAIEAFEKLQEQYCTTSYVEWALTKLSRKQKEFLKAFIDISTENDEAGWDIVCNRAKVVSEKSYVKKLQDLKLLLTNADDKLVFNSAIQSETLVLPTVRNISPSLRFDVLQRDNHICQYCGRTPPDVVLEIDHLVPVAKGGTDDYDNLVTSCRDCNAGKSDKLIHAFTGGYNRDEWRGHLHKRRVQLLEERRKQLDEVIEHWQECLNRSYLRKHDNEAIHKFIEQYEPDWIKAAIRIAAKKEIDDYVSYVAAILRNWAKDGPPDYIVNPENATDDRPATEKQIQFIQSLLDQTGLELHEFYHKDQFEDLTRTDACELINSLLEKD